MKNKKILIFILTVIILFLAVFTACTDDNAEQVEIENIKIENITESAEDYSNLPILELNPFLGTESNLYPYYAYNAEDLKMKNPWSETDIITKMPVFENNIYWDSVRNRFEGYGLSKEEAVEIVENIVSALDLTLNSLDTHSFEYNTLIIAKSVIAYCDNATINVNFDNIVNISFENGIPLPDGYNFSIYDISKEQEVNDVLQYWLDEYAYIFNMKSPVSSMWINRMADGKSTFFVPKAYERSDDMVENILNFHFKTLQFMAGFDYDNETDTLIYNNTLYLIIYSNKNLSQKIGDYPIIDAKQAKELLLRGNCFSLTPFDEKFTPNENNIAGVELIYNKDSYAEIIMPYYCFWIEMPPELFEEDMRPTADGLKTYLKFLVPAIKSEFLDRMPVWGDNTGIIDIQFNIN